MSQRLLCSGDGVLCSAGGGWAVQVRRFARLSMFRMTMATMKRRDVPFWICLPRSLYQFHSAYQDKGSKNDPILNSWRFDSWGDPERSDYGYIIATIERVTEYQIPVEGRRASRLFLFHWRFGIPLVLFGWRWVHQLDQSVGSIGYGLW